MGRSSLRSNATPSSSRHDSIEPAVSSGSRLTRSASSRNLSATPQPNDSDVAGSDAGDSVTSKKPRGRPRKSLLVESMTNSTSSSFVDDVPAPARRSGRPRKSTTATSVSLSSAPTPLNASSEDDLSTPPTSNLPTPLATDLYAPAVKSGSSSSMVVAIPTRNGRPDGADRERELRSSKFSMVSKTRNRKSEIGDSDEDEEEFSDNSPDAQVARRLQREENAKTLAPSNPRSSRRSSNITPVLAQSNQTGPKRGRASTDAASRASRSSKRAKLVISDSEDQLDVDEELARGLDYEMNDAGALSTVENDGDTEDYTEDEEDEEEYDDADGDDDFAAVPRAQPKSSARATARTNNRRSRGPGTAPAERTTQSNDVDIVVEDSEADEPTPSEPSLSFSSNLVSEEDEEEVPLARITEQRRAFRRSENRGRVKRERSRLEKHHPELLTMWQVLEDMPILKAGKAPQPTTISRQLKPFQLEGLAWMKAMEQHKWKGGLLGDEMGLGKTIQAVSLIMSDYPAKQPSLVLVPPVALMQWQSEIKSYTDGTLKTFVFHGTNQKSKGMTVKEVKKYDVIMMSYNSLESMYRKQEKGFKRKDGMHFEKSIIHAVQFHRVILDEAHSIKTRSTMTAKACFALKADYRWCLTGTPLQNRIGEFFSLVRFLNIAPFASYLCKQCPCSTLEWNMDEDKRCSQCNHAAMQHVSVFNQELLNPIQKFGNLGPGRIALGKLRLMTDRIMLRRLKKDHTNSMELPVKEIYVDRQFFGEEENDFANSIMTSGQRKFDTYVAQGVLLNNYANIFGLIMQMRQVADHPDLILKKTGEGGQNVLICCICDEPSEDTIRSQCKHDFCRACVTSYVHSTDVPDCPRCHIPLTIDLEQPEIEQDEALVKKNSIINRIKMENWTSSSKIELLVHELHKLRSDNATHKSIIFSQFTTMLQLIEWRLRRAGITTVMLDGSMTPAQRQASIEHFMNNVDVECFLVSLKAGGVALNLTEASRVFIVDPWWNPAAEWQSADRCHRIGQARPCHITRLCIEDSVESRMVLIQEKKTSMIHSTVNSDDKALESLTPQDMQFLFRGS
ncbi:unnamed protein product [Clonostachys byssicola]|uniref:DNA repair protein RAD16 n=1 Tax=Clonostachys byssicola TaxID=160290 RepID=A0A9N9Y0S9_9HYPO|nr:unnamed protein product [Clonostachys byssicola]